MSGETIILISTAVSIGFLHTLFGPDHYLPFIMMSKARNWSAKKTAFITSICGLGHVLSSVLLGFIGVFFGLALKKLEFFESFRGNLAAWGLIAFGGLYAAWGLKIAFKKRTHSHKHDHGEGQSHIHVHSHFHDHSHVHKDQQSGNMTPWVLFTIFVFGPCEPLIPLLMYPAARNSMSGLLAVTAVFCLVTLGTMLCTVFIGTSGLKHLPLGKLERFTHALAGAVICLSGLAGKNHG